MKHTTSPAVSKDAAESFFKLLRNGDLSKVRTALESTPELVLARDKGDTPLHFAFEFEQDRLVELLAEYDADFGAVAFSSGTTVREIAIWHKRELLFNRLHNAARRSKQVVELP